MLKGWRSTSSSTNCTTKTTRGEEGSPSSTKTSWCTKGETTHQRKGDKQMDNRELYRSLDAQI